MKKLSIILTLTIALAGCGTPVHKEIDYTEYTARQNVLRQFKAPKDKALLYVVNSDEGRGGLLKAFSGLNATIGYIQPNKFHAYCLGPGNYSLVYAKDPFESDPYPIHLEPGKTYGVIVSTGKSFFASPWIKSLTDDETRHFIGLRTLGPDPRLMFFDPIPQFPCDLTSQN
jgi:hypothetical protein